MRKNKKKFYVAGRLRKNLNRWDVAHEYIWNKTLGVYNRVIFADNVAEAKKLYKQSPIGDYCVIEQVVDVTDF